MKYSTKLIEFVFDGSPMGHGERHTSEDDRKRRVCEEARTKFQSTQSKFPLLEGTKVVCRFFLPKQSKPCDLDNLIKNLLDALGAGGLFENSHGGGHNSIWNRDDHFVQAIEASKEVVEGEGRTEVEVWTR